MLRERDVDARRAVVGRQVFVWHRPGEDEAVRRHLVLGDQRADHVVVARHAVGLADEDEAILGVDVALVVLGEPDVILDLLVGHDAADEQEIQAARRTAPAPAPAAAARGGSGRGRRRSGNTPVLAKPSDSSSCRLYSESPSATSVLPDQRVELLAAERREAEDAGIVRRKEMRRRDVVVLQHAAARQPRERVGHRRGQREVKDRHVAASRAPGRRTAGCRRAGRRPPSAQRSPIRGRARAAAPRTRRALSPMASPLWAAGTHWLTIIEAARPPGRPS